MLNKEKLLFLCVWTKNKKQSWSGTPIHLMNSLTKYFDIIDVNVSLNLFEKILGKLFSYRIEKFKIVKIDWIYN